MRSEPRAGLGLANRVCLGQNPSLGLEMGVGRAEKMGVRSEMVLRSTVGLGLACVGLLGPNRLWLGWGRRGD